jgi:alpha-tubulin suppressor-like RCC1 family protein
MTGRTKPVWLGLTAVLVALAVGCGGPALQEEEDSTGSAQLFGTMAQALSAADVTTVRVTVSAADMQARTVELVKTNNQWSGVLGRLPAGTGRTFAAQAFNSSGTSLYAGSVGNITVVARQTITVSLTLQEVNPAAPFENQAPVITALTASPGTVEPGGTVVLTATAVDANPDDTLTSAWSAPQGGFAQASSLSTTWTAPTSAGVVPLTLTVTDSKGARARVTFNVTINTGRGDVAVNTLMNTWPQVSNMTSSATALEVNESTSVSATASDNDGDSLSYSWAASCAGTWSNATSASAQFTATALPGNSTCNNCNLTVTVTDARNGQPIGGQTTGTLSICVGPRRTAVFPPEFTETFQSTGATSANGTVSFRVKAADPQGSVMSFAWAATAGTVGTPVTSASASDVVWTAPACAPSATPVSVTATVSNALGASVSHSFTVTGLPACAAQAAGILSAGDYHSARVKPDGTVRVWGYNVHGQVGDGSTTNRTSPVQVPGLSGVTALATGGYHNLALRQDGTLWAWGKNAQGQLGVEPISDRTSPVQVPGLSGITTLAAGTYHSLALRQDGTVWAWGYNSSGQLGDGSATHRTSPVQVPGLSGVTAIAAGDTHTVALRQDGTVWAWGNNDNGQLGDGSLTTRSSPTQVPGLSGVTAIATGHYHSLALRQDGTVWAWGNNDNGQLGDGSLTTRSSPVQVPDLSGVTALSAGQVFSLALRQDGTVWGWGYNNQGQLGDGSVIRRTSPVRTASLSGVTAISAGSFHSMALRQDGTVWVWGYNTSGQLGDGTTTHRSSPVQVPGL